MSNINLDFGRLNEDELNLILSNLDAELTFTDSNGIIRFYSKIKDKIFTRKPEIIGTHVVDCHSEKSQSEVKDMLEKFKSGKKNSATYLMIHDGKTLSVKYIALRDKEEKYKGTLEIARDISEICPPDSAKTKGPIWE